MENPFEAILQEIKYLQSKVDTAIEATKNSAGLDRDEFIQAEEAAKYMGVTKKTLYQYTSQKKIRHYKIGANLYFNKGEINEYIRKGLVESHSRSSIY